MILLLLLLLLQSPHQPVGVDGYSLSRDEVGESPRQPEAEKDVEDIAPDSVGHGHVAVAVARHEERTDRIGHAAELSIKYKVQTIASGTLPNASTRPSERSAKDV